METPTEHWVETVTGLAATGVEIIIALVGDRPMQAHPFVPMLQVASEPACCSNYGNDLDLLLAGDPDAWHGTDSGAVQANDRASLFAASLSAGQRRFPIHARVFGRFVVR